jgi:hypothetical protein
VTSIRDHKQDRNENNEPIIDLQLANGEHCWEVLEIAILCENKRFLTLLRNYSKARDNLFETQDDWMTLRVRFNDQCNQYGLSSDASVTSGEDGSFIPSVNSDGSEATGSDE